MMTLDALWVDVKCVARAALKQPVRTILAIVSVAVGIGANTAVFSLFNSLVLTPLPEVRNPDELGQLIISYPIATHNKFCYLDYQRIREGFPGFQNVMGWLSRDLTVYRDTDPIKAKSALVTGDFFEGFGVRPALGRMLMKDDDSAQADSVVLGYSFWKRVFAGNPQVLGTSLRINNANFTVVGVTPEGFGGAEIDVPRDLFVPARAVDRLYPGNKMLTSETFYWLSLMVRLRPGVTFDSARSEVRLRWPQIFASSGNRNFDDYVPQLVLEPAHTGVSNVREKFTSALVILQATVASVLLIACTNISSLLLIGVIHRRHEFAVKLALGATRARLIQAWVVESLLLAVVGGCAGLLLTRWITEGLLLFLPNAQDSALRFHISGRTLLFAAGVVILISLLVSLLPALQVNGINPNNAIKENTRGAGNRVGLKIIKVVVVLQLAIGFVLVFAALIFTRSLQNVIAGQTGIQRDGLLIATVNAASAKISNAKAIQLAREVLPKINSLPGVRVASFSQITPLSGRIWWDPATVPGYVPAKNELTTVYINGVTPRYFETMGTRILEGRDFSDADGPGSTRVAIVNQAFAQRYFKGSAIGRKFSVGNEEELRDLQIIGVVANTKYLDPRESPRELVYASAYQCDPFVPTIDIRVDNPDVMSTVAESARSMILDMYKAPTEIGPYSMLFDRALQQDRLVAILSGLFGVLGIVLSSMGLFGVMAFGVSSRTSEIGVRIAMGAQPRDVVLMIVSEAAQLAAIGLVIGIPLALMAKQLIAGILYGVDTINYAALLGSGIVLVVTALLSAALPAIRASAINPVSLLRS